jgi:hypothetical protein
MESVICRLNFALAFRGRRSRRGAKAEAELAQPAQMVADEALLLGLAHGFAALLLIGCSSLQDKESQLELAQQPLSQ